jgi:adenylate cyclase
MAALTYLLAEAALRPVFARALPARSDDGRATVGVRMRLLVTWAVGSGIPLLFILAIPLRGRGGRQLSMSVPMEFMAASGVIIGLVTTVAVAHSVADPLAAVRAGLKRVRQGDLDAAVAIDDPGEIGLLQASFNQMVNGLRERRELEDLFGRHVGEEVARRALEQGVRLGGEVREASALFVDLVGSTTMAREQPPQQVVALLNHFFDAVVTAVTTEGGWVNKFEGDAALCVFGVPAHQADHADRALRCARSLRDGILALARSHEGLDAGIGVSSGPMIAGNVGAEHRFEYTVIGDPVNEAARLTDVAKQLPERVAASGAVVMRAGAEAKRWQTSGAVTLRGRDVETEVFVPVASEMHAAQ